MGTSTLKSGAITLLDSSPVVRVGSWIHGGAAKHYSGTLETVTADDTSSVYRFFRVGSWMRPTSLLLYCDAFSTSAAINIGLWKPTVEGGAVVDADFFSSAVVVSSALNGSNVLYESAAAASNMGIENAEKRIWEVMGLTTDPNLEYDVACQPTSAITAGGTLTLTAAMTW